MDGEYPAETRPDGDEQATSGLMTGDDRVDETVGALTGLAELPVDEHPAVLEEIHRRLGEILGEEESGDEQSPP
jgi:hypothetical protein